VEDDYIMLHVR